MRWWLLLVVSLLACTKPNEAVDCSDGVCSDPNFPFCDVDGVLTGVPFSCMAVSCVPGELVACRGEQAMRCTESGTDLEFESCAVGTCIESLGQTPVHCPYLEPRYLPDICDTVAEQAELEITSSGDFDPNLDNNCTGGIVIQAGAPSICVVRYGSISIGQDATLRVTSTVGGTGRVIAFVADEDLLVAGTLDVGARGSVNGPGGGKNQSGMTATLNGGGGGGGGATSGGDGADETLGGSSLTNGGAPTPDPATLQALVGGHASTQFVTQYPDGNDQDFGGGGGGGGATLISCRGSVVVTGTILAGGGGGREGEAVPTSGFGGGAGGNVVLQGVAVTVSGQVFSNGGGGGSGRRSSGAGQRGADGSSSAVSPAPGGSSLDGAGQGGAGGFVGAAPVDGLAPTAANAGAGGGGGSVGFLQTYTPAGVEPALTPTMVSPAFRPNGVVFTR